jgi:hypothetical protein
MAPAATAMDNRANESVRKAVIVATYTFSMCRIFSFPLFSLKTGIVCTRIKHLLAFAKSG